MEPVSLLTMCAAFLVTASVLGVALAQSGTAVPSLTVSTAVASPSASNAAAPIPPQIEVPPKQDWCPSEIFCAGEASAPMLCG